MSLPVSCLFVPVETCCKGLFLFFFCIFISAIFSHTDYYYRLGLQNISFFFNAIAKDCDISLRVFFSLVRKPHFKMLVSFFVRFVFSLMFIFFNETMLEIISFHFLNSKCKTFAHLRVDRYIGEDHRTIIIEEKHL